MADRATSDPTTRGTAATSTQTDRPERRDQPDEASSPNPDGVPGGDADKPTEIPAKGWFEIVKRGWAEATVDQVPLMGAGVAFFAFLALFPGIIALVTLYGLFADPGVIAEQVNSLNAMPAEVRELIVNQINTMDRSALGWGAAVSIAIALFSASGGVNNLMTAINIAYDEEDNRNGIVKRLIALGLTLGAIVFIVVMLGLVGVLPPLINAAFGDNPLISVLLEVARWVLLVVLVAAALAVLYRVAPDRDAPKLRWVSVGAAVATLLWLVASVGFSVRVDVRQLRQDLWGVRRHRRAADVVVDHVLRHSARRRDQLRGGAADGAGHHHGSVQADGRARRGQGRLGPWRSGGARGVQPV